MTDNNRFEQLYPQNAREKELNQIIGFISKGLSCQLISIPGAGRSTVLRLLVYNRKVREFHLKEHLDDYRFVYVNFAELPGFTPKDILKSLFLALLTSTETLPDLHTKLSDLFKESLSLNDESVLLHNLKLAMQQLVPLSGINNIVFLFDRFSEFAQQLTPSFFTYLRSLRTAANNNMAVVFSTHRPLEELLAPDIWKDFYEFFIDNHVYLELLDKPTTDTRLSIIEKEHGKTLDNATKEELYTITGGHGKLMKLSATLVLDTSRHSGKPQAHPESDPGQARMTLADFLLSHLLIKGSLMEIWEASTKEEQKLLQQQKTTDLLNNLHLPFPLFSEFLIEKIPDKLVPKTVRLNDSGKEILFGDEPIAGLSSQEFRLLAFFVQHPDTIISRDEIISAVWSESKNQAGVSNEALDQMIYRLRKKIEDEADNPKHILTVKGRGFRFLP